jgi:hypothetical protein
MNGDFSEGFGSDLIEDLKIKDYLIVEIREQEGKEVTIEELMRFFQMKM